MDRQNARSTLPPSSTSYHLPDTVEYARLLRCLRSRNALEHPRLIAARSLNQKARHNVWFMTVSLSNVFDKIGIEAEYFHRFTEAFYEKVIREDQHWDGHLYEDEDGRVVVYSWCDDDSDEEGALPAYGENCFPLFSV